MFFNISDKSEQKIYNICDSVACEQGRVCWREYIIDPGIDL